MTYEEAMERIHSYEKFGSKLGLERMQELLQRLDHPEKDFKVIHVAGTNGKGSVCRYVYTVLQEAGYRAGAFFSPYIDRFTERIECGGQEISEEDLSKHTQTVCAAADAMTAEGFDSPTEFEIVTAIGFLHFAEQQPDFVILEVGLGGLGDSTNVIEQPLVTAITSIDFDHTAVLGDSLPEIAGQKAGIIKPGVPVVVRVEDEEAREVIRNKAASCGAPFIDALAADISDVVMDIHGYGFSASFEYDAEQLVWEKMQLSMAGTHQVHNAVCALHILQVLRAGGYVISDEAVRTGLRKAVQPARFEILHEDPYFIVDGAHNFAGAKALAYLLHEVLDGKNILICVGILKDKEYQRMAQVLNKLHCDFMVTSVPGPRGMPAFDLADAFGRTGAFVTGIYDNFVNAFDASIMAAKAYDAVVWTGSFYLMGPIKQLFEEME